MMNKYTYLTGSAISNFGDGCQQIAMMWLIYHLTGSALSIGIMIAIYYLPSIMITPFLSVFVDQRDSKKLTIYTDFFRFVFVGLVALIIMSGVESVYLLYTMQFILAVGYTLYKPSSQSFIKESFHNMDLAFVISKSSSFNQLATIIGSGLAGVLITMYPPSLCFILNAISYLCPAIVFIFVKRINKKAIKDEKIHYLQKIKEGFLFVKNEKDMSYLFFLSILNSIAIQMSATMLLPLAEQLKGGSKLYAMFDISFTVGGILAGFLVTFLMIKLNNRLILMTMSGMMVIAVLIGLIQIKVFVILLLFLFGYFTMTHLVATQTMIQIKSPKEMIGRVIGLRTMVASTVKISSALSTGFLINTIHINNILLLFGIILLLSLITFNKMKRIEFTLSQ
jgi:MFS transporter, DHA3 family, macrolide efflux protein